MLKHFSTTDQIQYQIIEIVIFVNISQSTYIGMTPIFKNAQQRVRFRLESGRVGVVSGYFFERHLFSRGRVSRGIHGPVRAFAQYRFPIDIVFGTEGSSAETAMTLEHGVAGRVREGGRGCGGW